MNDRSLAYRLQLHDESATDFQWRFTNLIESKKEKVTISSQQALQKTEQQTSGSSIFGEGEKLLEQGRKS